LTAAGYLVRAPLLSGHGLDVPALAKTTRSHWIASADEALTSLLRECDGPVAIVGSSAGGLIACHLAVTRPRDVSTLVLLATPVVLTTGNALGIRLALMLPTALRPQSLNVVQKPHGPNVSDHSLASTLRSLPAYPIAALGELLRLMADTRARLDRITQRVLIVHGALDAVVTRAQMDRLAATLANAASIERLDLPNSAHLLGIDRDRDTLAAGVVTFLRGR
jgi:carboxylesterase